MNQADPLAGLRDIHLPEPVSWWPPAPGWWLAVFVSLACLVLLMNFLRRRVRQNRYRRVALKKLASLEDHGSDMARVLEEISAILRRVAIQAYGRERVVPLTGDAWLDFLDKTGRTTAFSSGAARVLGPDLYRPSVEADIDQVRKIAAGWIREHRSC
jgi:hypothetical protein